MVWRNLRAHQGQITAQHCQYVVEVVRDAAGEYSKRIELLRLAYLGLEPPLRRNITDNADETARASLVVVNKGSVRGDPAHRVVIRPDDPMLGTKLRGRGPR